MAPDEIDPKALILLLWRRKGIILAATVIATVLGAGYSLMQPDVFQATSTLYPKTGSQDVANKQLLGGLGGLVGSFAANEGVDRIKQVAQSRSLLQEMVGSGILMGDLFPAKWDALQAKWKTDDSTKIPTLNQAAGKLRKMITIKFEKPGNAFRVETKASTPELTYKINLLFIETLNKRLSRVALNEAQKNQEYLSQKFGEYTDPYLRSKLENLVAAEIERAMLIHSEAVEIIDAPAIPEDKFGPRRGGIAISFGLTGFLFACFGCLARAYLGK